MTFSLGADWAAEAAIAATARTAIAQIGFFMSFPLVVLSASLGEMRYPSRPGNKGRPPCGCPSSGYGCRRVLRLAKMLFAPRGHAFSNTIACFRRGPWMKKLVCAALVLLAPAAA